MLNVYQSNAGLPTKSSLAVGDPSALQDTEASTVHKLLRSQDGTHGFWIQKCLLVHEFSAATLVKLK